MSKFGLTYPFIKKTDFTRSPDEQHPKCVCRLSLLQIKRLVYFFGSYYIWRLPLLHLKPKIIFVASLDQRGPINLDISVWSKRSDGMKRPEKLLRFVHLFGWMRYIWNILYCIIFPYQWKVFELKATPHSFQFHILSTRVIYWQLGFS